MIGLWLSALFVNPHTSMVLGYIWVASRYLYAILYGWYGEFTNFVEIPQQFTYAITFWFLVSDLYKCFTMEDLQSVVEEKSPYLMFVVVFCCNLTTTILFLGVGTPGTKVIVSGAQWRKQ